MRGGAGARGVPDPGQPRGADPAVHRRAHRHHRRDGRRLAAHVDGAAGVPGVRAGQRPGGAQRRLRHLVPARVGRRDRSRRGRRSGCSTPCTWPGSWSRATRPATTSSSTLAQVFHSPVAPDHRALTDARATVHVLHGLLERVGSLGVTSVEELASFTSRVTPQQRRKRYLADGLPSGPGVYVFRDARGRAALRRHLARRPLARPHLLHRLRAADPDGRDGRDRRAGRRRAVRHHAGGRGPRAAADRRAQAALQPPLAFPGALVLGQAHRRAVPPAVHRPHGERRRGGVPRAVREQARRRAGGARPARGGAAAPVHPTAVPARGRHRLRAGRDGPLRGSVHGRAGGRGVRRPGQPGARRDDRGRPRRSWPPCARGSAGWPRASASRRRRRPATGCSRSCARPPGASGWPRSQPPRSWSRPSERRPAAGSWCWSGTGGWPAPASARSARTRCPTSRRCATAARSSGHPSARSRRPALRRPSGSCAGWRATASAWSACPASGPVRCTVPGANAGSWSRWPSGPRRRRPSTSPGIGRPLHRPPGAVPSGRPEPGGLRVRPRPAAAG